MSNFHRFSQNLNVSAFCLYSHQSPGKHTYEFHIIVHTLSKRTSEKMLRLLYPYSTVELRVIFVYGKDFDRRMNIFFVPKSVQLVGILVLLFIFAAAIFLYITRQKLRLPHNDFPSALFDCWIPFIGGGNLRAEHRLERWFFAILLFGAFFIMSVFSSDLLDCVVRVLNAKVSTFAELAEINPPIYSNIEFYLDSDLIYEKLK